MATLGEARNGEARNGTAVKDLTANCYLWRKLMGWTKAHIKYRDALRAEYTSETGKRDYLLPDFEAWLVAREELPPPSDYDEARTAAQVVGGVNLL